MKRTTKIMVTLLCAAFVLLTCNNAYAGNNHRRYGGGLQEGYKGFVTAGYTIGTGLISDRLSINTTHGYQLNENFFIGAGVGMSVYKPDGFNFDVLSIPLYADARANLELNGSVSPFADLKIGYAIADVKGFFFNPSIGIRVDMNGSMGLNFGVGYELIRYIENSAYLGSYSINVKGITLKVGLDF